MKEYSIGTKCVQAGYAAGNGEPRQIPIIQSTTFKYDTSEDMGKLFDLEAEGYFYSRLQNPTREHLERIVATLDNLGYGSKKNRSYGGWHCCHAHIIRTGSQFLCHVQHM